MFGSQCQTLVSGRERYSRERAGPVDADPARMRAEVAAAREAVAAASADDVPLAGDDLAGMEIVDVAADGLDAPDEFVARDHRDRDGLLRPGIPVVDVYVRAADGVLEHPDEHVVHADLGQRDFFEPEAGFGAAFNEGVHGLHGDDKIASFRRRVRWAAAKNGVLRSCAGRGTGVL